MYGFEPQKPKTSGELKHTGDNPIISNSFHNPKVVPLCASVDTPCLCLDELYRANRRIEGFFGHPGSRFQAQLHARPPLDGQYGKFQLNM